MHIRTALTVLTLATASTAFAQMPALGSTQPVVPNTGMHVILLGTGVPLPNPDRAAASTLVVVNGKTFMVDTGRNSPVRLVEAGYNDADVVLYTHFHSDHYDGLGGLEKTLAYATVPVDRDRAGLA